MNIAIVAILAAAVLAATLHTIRRYRKGSACCGEHETVRRRGVLDRNSAHYPYEATLTIGGMTCENCARRGENALNELDGVWAKVRIDNRQARLRCKQAPDEAALRRAVREAGYVVSEYQVKP